MEIKEDYLLPPSSGGQGDTNRKERNLVHNNVQPTPPKYKRHSSEHCVR